MNISDMYNAIKRNNGIEQNVPKKEKLASRVLGGLKAQKVHSKTISTSEGLLEVPKIEYVKALEEQIKQLKDRIVYLEKENTKHSTKIIDIYNFLRNKR